jgi:hypothetical protein
LDNDEEEPKEKKKKVLKVCQVKFDRNLSNIIDVYPYNNKQWPTEAINYTVEFGTPLIINRLFVLNAADEDKMHRIYSKKEPSSSPYYLVNALSQHFSVRMEQLKDKSGIVLHDDANESQAAKKLKNFRVLTAMSMMDAKMQQFDKVASNMYQNGISTDSIDTAVKGFEDLESQKEFDGCCTMFELGRTIENIRINFDKLRKTLSDEVYKILTKLFKENNPPRKEKAMEVKRKKDFTYVEYIQYTFRNLKLLSDELPEDNTSRKGKRVSRVSYTYQSQVRYSRRKFNELVKVYLLLKLFPALISFPFNKQFWMKSGSTLYNHMLQLYEVSVAKKDDNPKDNIDNALYYLQRPPRDSLHRFFDCAWVSNILGIKIVSVAEVAPVYAGPKGNVPRKASNISVTQKKKRQPAKKSTKGKEKVQLKKKTATKKRKSSKEDDEEEEEEDEEEEEEEEDVPPPKKYKVGSLETLRKAVTALKIPKKTSKEG